jgi:hypothetical protein
MVEMVEAPRVLEGVVLVLVAVETQQVEVAVVPCPDPLVLVEMVIGPIVTVAAAAAAVVGGAAAAAGMAAAAVADPVIPSLLQLTLIILKVFSLGMARLL